MDVFLQAFHCVFDVLLFVVAQIVLFPGQKAKEGQATPDQWK